MVTYLTNYSNATLECVTNVIDNVTSNVCHGTIAVVPYNQDIIVALQVIQTSAIVLIAFYCLFMIALARR